MSARLHDIRRMLPLAWPVLVGQVAVLAFSTIDTVLVARSSQADLGALAVGGAAYVTVMIGLMGMLLAVSPVTGQLFGAGRLRAAGDELHQGIWLALGLSVLGGVLLLFPEPFLWLSRTPEDVAQGVRGYLLGLAVALPASLVFTVYRAFNTAVSRPKAVMVIQLAGLLLKIPLSVALVFGWPLLGVPAMGVSGCGVATAVAMWLQLAVAIVVLRRDPFYDRFELWGRGLHAPNWSALWGLLKLGVPIGMSFLIEVSGFSFMALFISRISTVAVAGHQIAMNLVSLLFMVPMALANAGSTLVAQRVGAGQIAEARRLGWHALEFAAWVALAASIVIYVGRDAVIGLYTQDPAVAAATLSLLGWLVIFHVCDAVQTVAAFVLRAWRIATVPMLIYAAALWGVGLGGGYLLAFNVGGHVPPAWQGAPGYWLAATVALVFTAAAMSGFMAWVLRARTSTPAGG